MKTADYPVWLAVMPDQRDAARADAGKHPAGGNAITWDKEAQLWYARPGADLSRLQAWLPDPSRRSGGGDPETEFLDALTDAGLIIDGLPVMDGEIHRVSVTDGPKGNGDGVYRGFLNGSKPGGWFINYWTAKTHKDITKWKATGGESDPVARLHMKAVARQSRDDSARRQADTHARQTAKAKALYERLPPADPDHAYLQRKGVTADDGIRQTRNGALVIPFQDVDGAFRTLQYIPPDGEKYLFSEAPKAGHFKVVGGTLTEGAPILYAEGYATARSLNEVTGWPVVMTIDAGNMLNVANVLSARYPGSPHLFMVDFDHSKPVNTGLMMGEQAALNTGGKVIIPDFTSAERAAGLTDFNDVHQSRGTEALRADLLPQIHQALAGLHYKENVMVTPDDAQPTLDKLPASPRDAAEATSARRPGAAKEKTDEILKLRDEGLKPAQIAEQLGIGQTSVYRILKAQQPEAAPVTPPSPAAAEATTGGGKDLPAVSPATERETITLYHGSPATFSAIDPEKIGLGQNFMGRGFYTDNSVIGVQYAMEEINHPSYHIYELEIPSDSIILDRWDSSSLTDELRERIRQAGKTVDQQLTDKGETSRLGAGERLAGCEKIDATFFMYANSPEGMSVLKEAGIVGLKDNSYIAIVNTDLIDNVRLRSAAGAVRSEMTQYIDKALEDAVQNATRLSAIMQEKPSVSAHYDAIRSELLSLVKTQNKPAEAERLTSLLAHTLSETIDSPPDRKTSITPLNRLYAEAIRSLDLTHNNSAATLAHLIDRAVINMNPEQKPADEPVKQKPESVEPVAAVRNGPAPEAPQAEPGTSADLNAVPEPIVPAPAVSEPPLAPATQAATQATTDPLASVTTRPVDFSAYFADINNRLRALRDEAGSLDDSTLAMRLGELINERIGLTEMWSMGNDTENAQWPTEESEVLEAELRAELDKRPGGASLPLTAAIGEENAILVGAARVSPQDEDVPGSSRIDADKLLSRITHEKQPDGQSVLYRLDGDPAFIDRGNRLVMAEGASAHEEKVLAALLTAANHYHGRIELTGSDEFKAFAIGVIVANKLGVSMKNASQQADLDAARRAAGQAATPVDAVRGDPPAPSAAEAPPAQSAQASEPLQNTETVTVSPLQRPGPVPEPVSPKISPAIHTPAEKAREPVTGKVTACGQAPFRFEEGQSESTFITMRSKEGQQTFWGKELAGLLRETNLKPGRMVTLQWQGEQPVTVKVPKKDSDGFITHYENVQTRRNQWSLAPIGGTRVQTGAADMVPLTAVDVNRYTQIQHTLVSRLGIDMDAPPKPADGLYWLKPDGQGSAQPGDPLSAPRPEHNERAGIPVMSAWGKDGQPDLLLVQGDGDYLQGIVRQNGRYQHVLVSLPGTSEAPPMVVNLLTPEGAQPIGNGNGINRSSGQPVPREHVVVRLTGEEQPRIAKLDAPADVPPALHARLGYDERYKAESGWVKEQPAAAPQAAPVTPPRPAQ